MQEPLIPQSTEHWTLDQLLARSLEEMRKNLGVPPEVVSANKSEQGIIAIAVLPDDQTEAEKPTTNTSKVIEDA